VSYRIVWCRIVVTDLLMKRRVVRVLYCILIVIKLINPRRGMFYLNLTTITIVIQMMMNHDSIRDLVVAYLGWWSISRYCFSELDLVRLRHMYSIVYASEVIRDN
jgi:hypothetical protein